MSSVDVILFLLLFPLVLSLVFAIFGKHWGEKAVARLAFGAVGLQLMIWLFGLFLYWVNPESETREWQLGTLIERGEYSFGLDLMWDTVSSVWTGLVAFFSAIIVRFSRRYLHREEGFFRFFSILFLFQSGLYLLGFAGAVDIFLIGWEWIGLTSFLLIAFYYRRLMPTRNAMLAWSVYRFCDAVLMIAFVWAHHELGNHLDFTELGATVSSHSHPAHPWVVWLIGAMMWIGAAGKSAQLPFSFWLPRAMEGPTPSSAIYYGALSVHAGVLLLIRTQPSWFVSESTRILIFGVGGFSALFAVVAGRVQTNIKGQIAYASIAQVGAMWMELALGLPRIALAHLAIHAAFRTYQILISPSMVAQLLKSHSALPPEVRRRRHPVEDFLPRRFSVSLYVLALREGAWDVFWRKKFYAPVLLLGRWTRNHPSLAIFPIAAAIYGGGVPLGLVVTALVLAVHAPFTRHSFGQTWTEAGLSLLLASLGVAWSSQHFLEAWEWYGLFWALGGVASFGAWIWLRPQTGSLWRLEWESFHRCWDHRTEGTLLLLGSLLVWIGFPISPAFVGVDLLLHFVPEGVEYFRELLILIIFLNSITLMRAWAHLAWGGEPG